MNGSGHKKILITGATGFVGSNLVRRLSRSRADIHILARKSSDIWRISDLAGSVTRYDVDLSDAAGLTDAVHMISPDIVYHLATYGGKPQEDNFRQIVESNLIGTANLVSACKKSGFDLFVNTGSSSEYGIKSAPMKEADLAEPRNNYGISKLAATLYCQSVARNENLPIITLRLFSPYGDFEDRHRLIPSVILSCLQGRNPAISSPNFVRDFIYIDDVIDIYERLPGAGISPGAILNAGSGRQHTVGEVAETAIRITGKDLKLVTGLPRKWPNEPAVWQADLSMTSTSLNWAPKYDLEAGLKRSIAWFDAHRHLYL